MIATTYSPARAARRAAALTLRATIHAIANAWLTATVRRRNGVAKTAFLASGQLVTVTTYLRSLGADDDLCRRYGSTAGKRIKAAFKASTGRDPLQVWTVIHGRIRQVAAYPRIDRALPEGVAAYPRTAHLLTPA